MIKYRKEGQKTTTLQDSSGIQPISKEEKECAIKSFTYLLNDAIKREDYLEAANMKDRIDSINQRPVRS